MNQLFKICLFTIFITNISLFAEDETLKRDRIKSVKKAIGTFGTSEKKELSVADNVKNMFSEGKVSGQLRSIYAGYDHKEQGAIDPYATAVGGMLKYELAEYKGFNGGIAFNTSYDVKFLTGDRASGKQNDELSSSKGHYTELTEAYINYNYENLNLRAGRQVLDTPLADSDDIRMIPNTFEAYVATYELNGFELMAGNIQRFQGIDAGLDDGWIKTGEDGTWFGGVSYNDRLEFNAWYYNVTKLTDASYIDIGYNYEIAKEIDIHFALQYLGEKELANSGVEASIYGILSEFVAYGLGFNIAYNKSDKKAGKKSYSGTGGGTLFTSMDTMILDEITEDRDARAFIGGLSYEIGSWHFLYAYGDFKGDANSDGEKAHIVEQDIGFEYNIDENFSLATIYVIEDDQNSVQKSENDWNRLQLMIAYNF